MSPPSPAADPEERLGDTITPPPGEAGKGPGLAAKIAVILVVVTVLVVAQRLGAFAVVGDRAKLKQTLLDLGPWGYLAFIGAYTALQPFGMPGTVFVMAAPLIWPWPVAFALSMTGTMSASVVGFSFARFVGRDWLIKRIPARFHKYDEALARRGFATVATLRFVFWMPPLLHAFFGLSKVPFWTHFWGSVVGYLVPLLVVSYFGERAWDAMVEAPLWVWLAVAGAVALIGLGTWLLRRRGRGVAAP